MNSSSHVILLFYIFEKIYFIPCEFWAPCGYPHNDGGIVQRSSNQGLFAREQGKDDGGSDNGIDLGVLQESR